MIFKKVTIEIIEQFRIIYHQTTGYSNPLIESVIYQEMGVIFFWGNLNDGNYMIFHKSGFAHISFNQFDEIAGDLCSQLDEFIANHSEIPDYLMLYNTPELLANYWKSISKKYFKIRKRVRYQIDEKQFAKLNSELYSVPLDHKLISLEKCDEYINAFDDSIWNKYYKSKTEFLEKSFGYIMINEKKEPVAISYLMCQVGRNSECSLITLPEFRKKGYGFIIITNYVAESIRRKVNVGWDCFIDNYTNEWVKLYGYTHIIREYDFVSFLKNNK